MIKNNKNLLGIASFNFIALVFSGMMFVTYGKGFALCHVCRTAVFSSISIYLFFSPHKIDFLNSFKLFSSSNFSEANVKVAKLVSMLIAISNASISVALYFD